MYRLTTCPEIALGLFSTSDSHGLAASSPTFPHARPPDSTHPAKKGVLIGHVSATQSAASLVTDESMEMPQDWQSRHAGSEERGQQEGGRTVVGMSLISIPLAVPMNLPAVSSSILDGLIKCVSIAFHSSAKPCDS